MTIPPDPATGSWHLDKRVPLALIFAIAVQTGTAIWWAATTTGRISNVEAMVQGGLTARLNRIEDKLDRLIESRVSESERPSGVK
jgi:hypothetical protein